MLSITDTPIADMATAAAIAAAFVRLLADRGQSDKVES